MHQGIPTHMCLHILRYNPKILSSQRERYCMKLYFAFVGFAYGHHGLSSALPYSTKLSSKKYFFSDKMTQSNDKCYFLWSYLVLENMFLSNDFYFVTNALIVSDKKDIFRYCLLVIG